MRSTDFNALTFTTPSASTLTGNCKLALPLASDEYLMLALASYDVAFDASNPNVNFSRLIIPSLCGVAVGFALSPVRPVFSTQDSKRSFYFYIFIRTNCWSSC